MARLLQIPFSWKVTLIVVLMVILSAIGVTGVAAYKFRQELYAREFSAAFTVYIATVNYLTAHYKAHQGRFERRNLDYVLQRRFLQLQEENVRHRPPRPTEIVVYDDRGILAYDYAQDGLSTAPRFLAPHDRPIRYRETYDRKTKTLRIGGPISTVGEVPGYVFITLPSEIEQKTAALFRDIFLTVGVVLAGSIAICSLLTARTLIPIQHVIRAAKRVRKGDLSQQVSVTSSDEIGLLAQTFNDMIRSLARRLDLMHRLQNWVLELSRIMDIQTLYSTLAELCSELLPSASFRLYLFDERNHRLDVAVQYERGPSPSDARDTFVTRTYHGNEPRYIGEDGKEDTQVERPIELAIPLLTGEEALGVLWAGRPQPSGFYDDETLTILRTVAQYAAVAIENVKLYAEREEKQRYEREMALAREIQMGLLPRKLPQVTGFEFSALSRPAFEVGGDYYDFIPMSEGRWCVVAADVSGKGVPAAMIVSVVRTLLHTCVQFEDRLDRILKWVNKNITTDLREDMFVTLNAIQLSPNDGTLLLYRAGHEPALLIRASGEIDLLSPDGPALGLVDVATFEASLTGLEVHLEPGDQLLLFTDGVTEAQNEATEEFGLDRVMRAAQQVAGKTPSETINRVVTLVQEFLSVQPQQDDITLVAIRRTTESLSSHQAAV